jgi:TRAP-type uncharacterized transport system fused permease subunit
LKLSPCLCKTQKYIFFRQPVYNCLFEILKQGLHYLIPIGILLYELIYKRHTPLRAAYKAIILIFIVILYQEIRESFKKNSGFAVGLKSGVKIIFDGLARGSKNMMSVALACGAAGIIIYL